MDKSAVDFGGGRRPRTPEALTSTRGLLEVTKKGPLLPPLFLADSRLDSATVFGGGAVVVGPWKGDETTRRRPPFSNGWRSQLDVCSAVRKLTAAPEKKSSLLFPG